MLIYLLLMKTTSPFKCHVFVCVNDRQGQKYSCADDGVPAIRALLKAKVEERWDKEEVRVTQSQCLGPCRLGPNVVLYPQNIWFTEVKLEDVEMILDEIGRMI